MSGRLSALEELQNAYGERLEACMGDESCREGEKKGQEVLTELIALYRMTENYTSLNWDNLSKVTFEPKGIVVYTSDSDEENAKEFIEVMFNRFYLDYAENRNVHAVVDGTTGKCYQILPWNARASHDGTNLDETHLAVLLWSPDRDGQLKEYVKNAYETAAKLLGRICAVNGWNTTVIVSQLEGRIVSGNDVEPNDPETLWKQVGSYTMDHFRSLVEKETEEAKKANIDCIYDGDLYV